MAQLARPPGLPSPLEGILDLGGTAVPVLRLDRLLRLPAREAGLYSMLIVLKGLVDRGSMEKSFALLVDRASEVRAVSFSELLPIAREDSFNECAEASFFLRGQTVSVLSPQRILLGKERQALSEFQTLTQLRVEDWGSAQR